MKALMIAAVVAVSFGSFAMAETKYAEEYGPGVTSLEPQASFPLGQFVEGTWDDVLVLPKVDADGDTQAVFGDNKGGTYTDKRPVETCPFYFASGLAETADECVSAMFGTIKELRVPHERGNIAEFSAAYEAFALVEGRMREFERSPFNVPRLASRVKTAKAMLTIVDAGLKVGFDNLARDSLNNNAETVLSSAF